MKAKETLIRILRGAGMEVLEPLVRLAAREDPRHQLKEIALGLGAPALACILSVIVWSALARSIETPYGSLPTPGQVWVEARNLVASHYASRREQAAFYEAREEEAAALLALAVAKEREAAGARQPDKARLEQEAALLRKRSQRELERRFSSSPTYFDQIFTSLCTVFAGFAIASLVAVPAGILCGTNRFLMAAMNPLIQILKPVSPLAWLPIVMIVVASVYTTDPREAWFEKSFINSAVTVALCSLWPTLVNTALGVASIERDHLNVARMLRLGWLSKVRAIVIPSSLPLIFAGLRISLGVGWMVLIAAEMLAQNPGLGKFVWDMFQNGSSQTMAQIMVAVLTIGIIGFLLDRMMCVLERSVTYGRVSK